MTHFEGNFSIFDLNFIFSTKLLDAFLAYFYSFTWFYVCKIFKRKIFFHVILNLPANTIKMSFIFFLLCFNAINSIIMYVCVCVFDETGRFNCIRCDQIESTTWTDSICSLVKRFIWWYNTNYIRFQCG